MKGSIDMTDIKEGGTFKIPTPGIYDCEIVEKIDTDKEGNPKKTKNGDDIVLIKLLITDGEFSGCWMFDCICFAPGILGRTKHFLHCIGCKYEGQLDWDSEDWLYKHVRVNTDIEAANQYHKNDKAVVKNYILLEGEELKKKEEDEDGFDFPG